jgi:hypothetical protein
MASLRWGFKTGIVLGQAQLSLLMGYLPVVAYTRSWKRDLPSYLRN